MPVPSLETPPNPVELPTPVKVRTGRYGELEEHELITLLDSLDDERARARFRESVYISVFVWVIVSWFVFYGPRVLFHQPHVVNPFDVLKAREMTELRTPADLARQLQRAPKAGKPAPAARPQIDTKTLDAMRRAAAARPLPATPQPQQIPVPERAPVQPPPTTAQSSPLPTMPRPAAPSVAPIPDAPRPAPEFANQSRSAGENIRGAMEGAARNRGVGGDYGNAITPSHVGVGTGVDILSDTMGVNFDPYLKRIMRDIYNNWIPLIPEEARPPLNKQGTTQIRFKILPDGRIGGMTLEGSTHDDALNRAAWSSITAEGQFPALPSEFHGPNLELRIHYLVNQRPE